jgi:hypothetical protein
MDLSFRFVCACVCAERVDSLFLSNHTSSTLGNSPSPAEANSLRNPWVSCFQEEPSETMKYPNPDADDIIYLVTARGHDHRIKASHILGRFVSLERISRVLPPLE